MLTFTSSSKPVTRHIKLLLYGGPGTGKTHLALHAPTPLVIDTESSTDAYRGRSDIPEFWVAKSAQPSEILETLEHLAQHGSVGGITPQTLIVDSFSVLWQVRQEAGQKKAERHAKNPDQARVSYYDWAWIKRPIQRLYTQLVNMPFNIILTAREKAVYDEIKEGNQTKLEIVDYVPDIERNAEYVFDLVLRLFVAADGKRQAEVRKSRFPAFSKGSIIDAPSWEMVAPLLLVGEEASVTPDVEAAAEAEATAEPAPWTQNPAYIARAETFLRDNGLSDADANAALGIADWRKTHLSPDEFKDTLMAYIDAQLDQAASAPPTVEPSRARPVAENDPAATGDSSPETPAPPTAPPAEQQPAESATPAQPPLIPPDAGAAPDLAAIAG